MTFVRQLMTLLAPLAQKFKSYNKLAKRGFSSLTFIPSQPHTDLKQPHYQPLANKNIRPV